MRPRISFRVARGCHAACRAQPGPPQAPPGSRLRTRRRSPWPGPSPRAQKASAPAPADGASDSLSEAASGVNKSQGHLALNNGASAAWLGRPGCGGALSRGPGPAGSPPRFPGGCQGLAPAGRPQTRDALARKVSESRTNPCCRCRFVFWGERQEAARRGSLGRTAQVGAGDSPARPQEHRPLEVSGLSHSGGAGTARP